MVGAQKMGILFLLSIEAPTVLLITTDVVIIYQVPMICRSVFSA